MSVVLDASAVLAYLRDEPGAHVVGAAIGAWVDDAAAAPLVSMVNWIEIAERVDAPGVLEELGLVLERVPLDLEVAAIAAALRPPTRALGLSLADRACLGLACARGWPVLTADRAWAQADVGVDVRLVR